MMIVQITKKINEKQKHILSNINSRSVDNYIFIKKEFAKGDILNNKEFQSRFKSFYRMNTAGLSIEQKKRFFELLSDKEQNLEYILSELHKIPRINRSHSIQFSFATKLIHTVNNNKPIYDINIGKITDVKVKGSNKNEKIHSCAIHTIYALCLPCSGHHG